MSLEITALPIAALITSTVAVSLFVFKEVLEIRKKNKEKKAKINAIRDIAAREAFNITREIELFIKLKSMLNGSKDVEFIESHGGEWIQFCFNYESSSRFVFIPKYSTMFNHLFLVESAKASQELSHLLHNLNVAIFNVSMVRDSCIGYVKNKDYEGFNDTVDFVLGIESDDGNDMVLSFLSTIDKFKVEMEKFNGFNDIYSTLNSHYRPKSA